MKNGHIVVATDFSELSQRALAAAKRLAQRFSSRISLVHVYSLMPPAAAYPAALWPAAELDQQVAEDARRSLEELAKRKLADIERVDIEAIHHPNAAIAIADYAEAHRADLVVVGTHGRTGLAHFLIGSVAEAVVRHAPCPVMAFRPTVEIGNFPRHVLACTDFSTASESALEAAGEMARAFEARVTLLHVYVDALALPGRAYQAFEAADESIKKALAELERKHFGAEVTTALLVGPSAADAITSYALRHDVDLTVLSTHGRTGMKRLVLGSVAEKVVRHSSAPVLVARSRFAKD